MMENHKKIARIYCRVSTQQQDLERQKELKRWAEERGYYVAKLYAEKDSGRRADRVQLNEMIADLQDGETVIAENVDRISRLPIKEAEALVGRIRAKGARLAFPNIIDLAELDYPADSMAGIVAAALQELLLKIALKSASDDYELRRARQKAGIQRAKAEGRRIGGRRISQKRIDDIAACRAKGLSISDTARVVGCGISTVKRIAQKIQAGEYLPTTK